MVLAGDVGGTKTLLGLFGRSGTRPRLVTVREFPTLAFEDLPTIIRAFLAETTPAEAIEAGAFGVAGPVLDNAARLVNVPWTVDGDTIASEFAIPRVALLNDLAAMAYAVPVLRSDEMAVLQTGSPVATGNAALIAAGTGLGEALLHNIGGRFVAAPSEAGHADFAARTPRELELVRELSARYGRVDCERVISGPGLVNLFGFTHKEPCGAVGADVPPAQLAGLISAAALENRCGRCKEALGLFVSAYGAEAGNLALRSVSTAGLFVGGGIAPKILPALQTGTFVEAFRAKGPLEPLLTRIPISVILNSQAGLLGAAVAASLTLAP